MYVSCVSASKSACQGMSARTCLLAVAAVNSIDD